MAPEQIEGRSGSQTTAVDAYSLGVILYELLVGETPFAADTTIEILRRVCTVEPVRPSQRVADLPLDLETICLKCLEKSPERRYSSAHEGEITNVRIAGAPGEERLISVGGKDRLKSWNIRGNTGRHPERL